MSGAAGGAGDDNEGVEEFLQIPILAPDLGHTGTTAGTTHHPPPITRPAPQDRGAVL